MKVGREQRKVYKQAGRKEEGGHMSQHLDPQGAP